jgi:hypothetical protein
LSESPGKDHLRQSWGRHNAFIGSAVLDAHWHQRDPRPVLRRRTDDSRDAGGRREVTSAGRWPTLPDVPTMAEAGQPDFVVTSWGAFVLSAGTPRNVVDGLSAAMREIATDATVQRRFLVAGARTPEQASARAIAERPMWKEMVRISGARPI